MQDVVDRHGEDPSWVGEEFRVTCERIHMLVGYRVRMQKLAGSASVFSDFRLIIVTTLLEKYTKVYYVAWMVLVVCHFHFFSEKEKEKVSAWMVHSEDLARCKPI
jgi:hypothetical protein